jgi:MYXO-CTERM domain-containing protein
VSRALALALTVALRGTLSLAEEPVLGTGQHGPLQVTGVSIVNRYAPLLAPADAGATTLETFSGRFFPGELLLLVQMTERAPADAGALVEINQTEVGRYERVRVEAVEGDRVSLRAPLTQRWLEGTQLVFVPEYTSVNIAAGGTLTGNAWTGGLGGVVAFLAMEEVQNGGLISARGLGFRGGVGGGFAACPVRAYSGEGLWGQSRLNAVFPDTGTGGRGGSCAAGLVSTTGGGGANAGRGGYNGVALGGLPLRVGPGRLTLGGGGGAGVLGSTRLNHEGGAGGGVVFVRARTILGAGRVDATGSRPPTNAGAGAGGTIDLGAVDRVTCSEASAAGASTAWTNNTEEAPSPGGGGRVVLQASHVDCTANVNAGIVNPGSAWPQDALDPNHRGEVVVIEQAIEGERTPSLTAQPRTLSVGCGCGTRDGSGDGGGSAHTVVTLLSMVAVLAARRRRLAQRTQG